MEYGATSEHLAGSSARYVELFDRHDELGSSSRAKDATPHSSGRVSRIRYKYARVSKRIVRPGSCVLIRLKAHLRPGVGLVNELFEDEGGEAMVNITWLYSQSELPHGHDKTVPAVAAQAMLFEKPASCASTAGQGGRENRLLYLTNHKQDLEAKSIMQPCVVYFLDRQPGEPCILATFQDGKRVYRPRPGFICRCFFDVIRSRLFSLDEARSLLRTPDAQDVADAMRGTQEFMAGHSPPICLSIPQVPPRPMTKWERNQDILKHIKNMSDLLDEANAHPSCIDGTWASSFDASLQRLAASIAPMTHERTVLDMRAMQNAKRTAGITEKEKRQRHREWQDRAEELVAELPSLSNDARELLGSTAQRLQPGTLPYRKAQDAGITRVMAAWLWQIWDAPNPQQLQELKDKRRLALLELLGAMHRIAPTKDDLQWIVDLGFGVLVLRPMGKRDWYEAEISADASAEARSQRVQAEVYRTKTKYMKAAQQGEQSQGDEDVPAPGPSAQQAHGSRGRGTASEVPPSELAQASRSDSRPAAQATARPLPPAPARVATVQRPPAPRPKRPEPPKPPEPPKSILVKAEQSKVSRDKASTSTRRRIRFADEAGGSLFTPGISEVFAAKLAKAREDEFKLNQRVVYATVSKRIIPAHQVPPASGRSSTGQGTEDMDERQQRRKAAEARGMTAWEGKRNRAGQSAASSRIGPQSDRETPSGSTSNPNGNQGLSTAIAGPTASSGNKERPATPTDAGIAIVDGQASTSGQMVVDCGPERNGKSHQQGRVPVSKKRKLSASANLDVTSSSSSLDSLGPGPRPEPRLEGNQDESRAAKSKRGDEEAGNSLSALPPSRAGNDNGAPSRTGQDTSGSIAEVPETSLASADVPETNSSATHSAAAAGGAENEAAAPEDDENSDDELPLATFTERNSTVGGGTRINVELRFGKRSAAAEYDVEDKMIFADGGERMTLQQWFARTTRVRNPTFQQAAEHVHVTSLGVEITLALYLDEACMVCASVMDESNMIICDGCEHCWHTYCHDPEVKVVPEGKWFCNECLKKLQALSHEELLRLI